MEDGKKAKELASKYARQYHHNTYPESSSNGEFVFSDEEIEKACLEMAEWKDKQFGEEKKKLVEKLSKWILENINKPFSNGGYISYVPPKGLCEDIEVYCAATRLVEDLKNIMEGE